MRHIFGISWLTTLFGLIAGGGVAVDGLAAHDGHELERSIIAIAVILLGRFTNEHKTSIVSPQNKNTVMKTSLRNLFTHIFTGVEGILENGSQLKADITNVVTELEIVANKANQDPDTAALVKAVNTLVANLKAAG